MAVTSTNAAMASMTPAPVMMMFDYQQRKSTLWPAHTAGRAAHKYYPVKTVLVMEPTNPTTGRRTKSWSFSFFSPIHSQPEIRPIMARQPTAIQSANAPVIPVVLKKRRKSEGKQRRYGTWDWIFDKLKV